MPSGKNINRLMQDGLALFNTGRLDEAEACYQSVLKRQPRNVDALHLLALIYLNTKRFEKAEQHLKKVIRLTPFFLHFLTPIATSRHLAAIFKIKPSFAAQHL